MDVMVWNIRAEKVALPVSDVVHISRVVERTSDITVCQPLFRSFIDKLGDIFSQSLALSLSSRLHCKGKK